MLSKLGRHLIDEASVKQIICILLNTIEQICLAVGEKRLDLSRAMEPSVLEIELSAENNLISNWGCLVLICVWVSLGSVKPRATNVSYLINGYYSSASLILKTFFYHP